VSATTEKAWIHALLHDAYPRHTAKQAARAAEAPLGTARGWVAGRFAPSAETLLRMAARCDAMADALERMIHARRAAAPAGGTANAGGLAAQPREADGPR
jgi:hypothetical protein